MTLIHQEERVVLTGGWIRVNPETIMPNEKKKKSLGNKYHVKMPTHTHNRFSRQEVEQGMLGGGWEEGEMESFTEYSF